MNNDDRRGDATTFLFDIVKMIDAAGIKTDQRASLASMSQYMKYTPW